MLKRKIKHCKADKFIIINRKWIDHDVKLSLNISSDVDTEKKHSRTSPREEETEQIAVHTRKQNTREKNY